jgi:hypothetical protein
MLSAVSEGFVTGTAQLRLSLTLMNYTLTHFFGTAELATQISEVCQELCATPWHG